MFLFTASGLFTSILVILIVIILALVMQQLLDLDLKFQT